MSLTADERIKAAAERRAKRLADDGTAREEQYATDLEAIDALESTLGVRLHISEQVRQFTPGLPVVVAVRAPNGVEYKRLLQKISRSNNHPDAKVAAVVELAESCWAYPDEKAARDALKEANPGLIASVGNFANTIAEVAIREEGKG